MRDVPPPWRFTLRRGLLHPATGIALLVLGLHLWLLASWPAERRVQPAAPGKTGPLVRPVWTLPTPLAAVAKAPAAAPAQPIAASPAAAPRAPLALANAAGHAARKVAPSAPSASATAAAARPAAPNANVHSPSGAANEDSDEATTAATAPPAVAPPTYPTRIPAPAELRYAMRLGNRQGQATLDWQHDGSGYRLGLQAADARGAPLLQQSSQGGFDAAGLAPLRFVDQRRGRGARAANFERESGRIGFSAAPHDHPAWPGAQDRLAWIVQLAAIANAAAALPPEVSLFVVDARGGGSVWTFVAQGEVMQDTALGAVRTQHVLREAQGLFDWRVEAWLDAQRGHWPVRLRMTVPRSGAVFELQLAAEPLPR